VKLPEVAVYRRKDAPPAEMPLPPSFSPSGFRQFLLYELNCQLKRGFLTGDQLLPIPFRYVPRKVAQAPSILRMISYADQTPIPGPDIDPDGWISKSAQIRGKLFANSDVQVTCQFSLACPLEYPRGFPIPFGILLESEDAQALDLLAGFKGMNVTLQRHVQRGAARGEEFEVNPDVVGRGRYWSGGAAPAPGMRRLTGEIPVVRQLMQGFAYPKMELCYSVRVVCSIPGLAFGGDSAAIVFPVDIVYLPASGPTPVSHAPPRRHGEESPVRNVSTVANLPDTGAGWVGSHQES